MTLPTEIANFGQFCQFWKLHYVNSNYLHFTHPSEIGELGGLGEVGEFWKLVNYVNSLNSETWSRESSFPLVFTLVVCEIFRFGIDVPAIKSAKLHKYIILKLLPTA